MRSAPPVSLRPQSFRIEAVEPPAYLTPTPNAPFVAATSAFSFPAAKQQTQTYLASRSSKRALRYFRNPIGSPNLCVALMIGGKRVSDLVTMADDGANVHLMTRQACVKKGVSFFPSAITLTTSNALSTKPLGVTGPVTIVYGCGPNEVRVDHCFVVVEGMDSVFEVLLGNVDTEAFAGVIDAKAQTYSLTRNPACNPIVLPTVMRST
jgi:hypothetical protein